MCGRFTLAANLEQLQLRFDFDDANLVYQPRYNVAPTQPALTVVRGSENRARFMRWGLIPSWARDASIGSRMINARAETLAEKRSFRTALQKRRCLVLADGFYEWKAQGRSKTPMYFALKSGAPFALAGLWETWSSPSDEVIHSCTIITTTPNGLLEPVHNRMPVILPPQAEAIWLDREVSDVNLLTALLSPYPADDMTGYAVSSLVNSPANDTPACIAPV